MYNWGFLIFYTEKKMRDFYDTGLPYFHNDAQNKKTIKKMYQI